MTIHKLDLLPGDCVEVRVAASEDGPVIDAGNAAEIEVLRRQIVAMQDAHEEEMQRLEGLYRERLRAAIALADAVRDAFVHWATNGESVTESFFGEMRARRAHFMEACRQ